jgi:OmcA/MtrC family decaheme c-type cytochrome
MASRSNNRFLIFSLMLVMSFLWACSGNDGAAGPTGPQGPQGNPGGNGPPGSAGGVPIDSANKINIEVESVTVPGGGGAPVVELKLTNDLTQGLDGLPAGDIRFTLAQLSPAAAGSGGSSAWQSYITTTSNGVPNAQATTETATAGTFTENGGGSYTYTFSKALTAYPAGPTFDMNKTHRIGVEIRGQAPISSNGILDFVPAGGAPTFERRIVSNAACDACHDRLEFHGGPRTDVTYCVTCHNPYSTDEDSGNSVDLKRLVHNIHSGRDGFVIIGYGGSVHDYSDVVWPQDIRNCQTCHQESNADTPQASNWRLVANRWACGTCHYDDGVANSGHDYAIEDGVHPGGLQFNDDTQCLDCHGPNGTVVSSNTGRLVQTPIAHEILEKTAAESFSYNILSVTNTAQGENPVITFSVTNPKAGNAAYDIATAEPFVQCAGGASRLAINVAWSTTDYANIGSGSLPGTPVSMNPLTACGGTSSTSDNQTFTVTSPVAIPATATGTLSVAIEGHPAVDVYNSGSYQRIAVTNAIQYAPITDSTAVARRTVVDIQKCDDCHNNLSLHGNNRTDKPEVCVTCHNPMMTDISRRAGQCAIDLGTDDQTIDMKRMIHAIHASETIGVPFEVCGFGNSTHVFDFAYPGHLNNCEGCHLPGTYYPVDPAKVFGTTMDANNTAILTDDRVISPNTSVCSACHTSNLAAEHMQQNGGDFNATKAADGSLISSGYETCELCHGPGRTADVAVMHGVADFVYN